LTYLLAWVVADARHKGALTGLATWYTGAFSAKVFGDPRPSGYVTPDVSVMRDKLVELGELDAVAHARSFLGRTQNALANGTDQQVLEAFRKILIEQDGGNRETAKWRLRK